MTSVSLAVASVTAFAPPSALSNPRCLQQQQHQSAAFSSLPTAFSNARPGATMTGAAALFAPTASYASTFTRLYAKKNSNRRSNDHDDHEDLEDDDGSPAFPAAFDDLGQLESARKAFEKLWVQQHRQETVNPADLQQYYSMLNKRHEQEVRLIKRLEFSDDAVKELLKLWSTTIVPPVGYGPMKTGDQIDSKATTPKFATATPNTMLTLDAEFLHAKSPDDQQDREAIELIALAEQHPDWAEPRLRLAAYHHRRGEVLQAYEWALKGLEIQPYHFVSSTIFLLLSIQQQHDAEIEYWERMRLPTGFGSRRTAWVLRALHECHERYESQASDIRKILDQRQHKSTSRNSNAPSSPRSVVVSQSSSATTQPSGRAFEQLSPMQPDVDVNNMFGGLSANNVDPYTASQHRPVARDHHAFRTNSATPSPSTSFSSRKSYDDEFNPRPNFGDDHWSNNPHGVFDIHGRIRDGTHPPSSSAADSMSNLYQFPTSPSQQQSSPSSRRSTSSSSSPPPSYDQLEGFGEWQ
jgi:tetratricopeptide (TPR) repeat protein